MKSYKLYLMTFLILILISQVAAAFHPVEINNVDIIKLRNEVKNLEEKIKDIENEIKEYTNIIDGLSKDKAKLKKQYKKKPSPFLETRLNKVLSELRYKIEEMNKLEVDKNIKKEQLKKVGIELIILLSNEIGDLLTEISDLEKKNETSGIFEKIEIILKIQEEINYLYKNINEKYPEVSKVVIEIDDDDSPEILNEKLDFVNDQLFLLNIREQRLKANRDRLLLEYKILQLLIDFYNDPSTEKEEMFDQMEIISVQIEELNNSFKKNKELIETNNKLKLEITEYLKNSGG
ncbi:hypothetical protein KAU33_06440 [Candidatus Dependentiae bacterium]|nr:hypothetical protein [Candidatus Dependentiae bacterium]